MSEQDSSCRLMKLVDPGNLLSEIGYCAAR
jgi:hypothetical protein